MTTVFPPQYRNFPKTDFEWAVGSKLPAGVAIIDGCFAAHASMAGGETVTISVNGGGATPVVMQAGDNTATLVADRINTVFAGLASVNDGRVRLTASSSVAVTAYSNRTAFDRIGLPIVTRDTAAAASTSYAIPISSGLDRVDAITDNAMDVPQGANSVGVFVSIEPTDPNDGGGARISYSVLWELEGGIGAPPYTFTVDAVSETVYDEANANFPNDSPTGSIPEALYVRHSRTITQAPLPILSMFMAPIPPGAVKMRILVSSLDAPAGPGDDSLRMPISPPILKVTAWPGAR